MTSSRCFVGPLRWSGPVLSLAAIGRADSLSLRPIGFAHAAIPFPEVQDCGVGALTPCPLSGGNGDRALASPGRRHLLRFGEGWSLRQIARQRLDAGTSATA